MCTTLVLPSNTWADCFVGLFLCFSKQIISLILHHFTKHLKWSLGCTTAVRVCLQASARRICLCNDLCHRSGRWSEATLQKKKKRASVNKKSDGNLPCESWSYLSAFSRYWSEGQTLQQSSALFLRSLHRGRKSDHPAPPHQSSDEPSYISGRTVKTGFQLNSSGLWGVLHCYWSIRWAPDKNFWEWPTGDAHAGGTF